MSVEWTDEPEWTEEEEARIPPLRVGEDGHLTLRSEPKACVPVTCPPERSTLLGVPEGEQGVRLPPVDEFGPTGE